MKNALKKKVVRASSLPVTKKMLYRVRYSLRSDTTSLRYEMKAGFAKMEARFAKIDSPLHQMHLLLEEQNAKNNFVMDGLNFLYYRQERLEKGEDV